MLRLLIRITTENPSAWIIFIIAIEALQCFSFPRVELPGMKWVNPERFVCYLIRFPSPFQVARMCRRSCIVLIDLSVEWVEEERRKEVSIVPKIGTWMMCFAAFISHINRTRIWSNRFCNSFCKLWIHNEGEFLPLSRTLRANAIKTVQVGEKSNTT